MSFFAGTERGKVPASIKVLPAVEQKKKGDQNLPVVTHQEWSQGSLSQIFITNTCHKSLRGQGEHGA